jgi:putative DNA primase/helicase
VNIVTGEVEDLTPKFWAHNVLPYRWEPGAKCPRWEEFLDQALPNDQESWAFLEEFLGCCFTNDTRIHKGAQLIGKRRAGKGLIIRMAERLIGADAFTTFKLDTWTATENSYQTIIGKRLAAFPDESVKEKKWWGSKLDRGGLDDKSISLIKSITGNDKAKVGRKNIPAWEGFLPTKILIAGNRALNFKDPTLATRFINVAFGVSFEGREDPDLEDKLAEELSGIAQKCVAGYHRLKDRGHYIQPASGLNLSRQIRVETDPWELMADECFVHAPGEWIVKKDAFARFESWCRANPSAQLFEEASSDSLFSKRLRDLERFAGLRDYPRPHKTPPRWWDIKLKD